MKTTLKNSYGPQVIDDQTFFVKVCKYDITAEINGYNLICNLYKCPKLLSFDKQQNKLVFEYCQSFDKLIMHNQLYHSSNTNFENVINTLIEPIKNLQLTDKNLLQNEKFFSGRKQIIQSYFSLQDIEKNIIFNQIKLPKFEKVLKNILKIANKNYKMYSCILQGDPTDLNCTIDGFVTDYEVAGQNSITAEIAIFCGCYIVNSYYYYIKYMKSAHAEYVDTLNKYKHHINPSCVVDKKYINITAKNILPTQNKQLITKYLTNLLTKLTKKQKKNIEKYLNLYIATRFITPVNLKNVDSNEKYLLYALSSLFFLKAKKIEDTIQLVNML